MKRVALLILFLSFQTEAQVIRENSDLMPEAIVESEPAPLSPEMRAIPVSFEFSQPARVDPEYNELASQYGPPLPFAMSGIRATNRVVNAELATLYVKYKNTRENIYYLKSLNPRNPKVNKLLNDFNEFEKDFQRLANKRFPSRAEIDRLKRRQIELQARLDSIAEELNVSLLILGTYEVRAIDNSQSLFREVEADEERPRRNRPRDRGNQ